MNSLKLWVVYKITYYEITYGQGKRFYAAYDKAQRQAIAYNIANEYLNF